MKDDKEGCNKQKNSNYQPYCGFHTLYLVRCLFPPLSPENIQIFYNNFLLNVCCMIFRNGVLFTHIIKHYLFFLNILLSLARYNSFTGCLLQQISQKSNNLRIHYEVEDDFVANLVVNNIPINMLRCIFLVQGGPLDTGSCLSIIHR